MPAAYYIQHNLAQREVVEHGALRQVAQDTPIIRDQYFAGAISRFVRRNSPRRAKTVEFDFRLTHVALGDGRQQLRKGFGKAGCRLAVAMGLPTFDKLARVIQPRATNVAISSGALKRQPDIRDDRSA